jgi:hypothetical protein
MLPGLLHPDRWLLLLGLLFVTGVYFFRLAWSGGCEIEGCGVGRWLPLAAEMLNETLMPSEGLQRARALAPAARGPRRAELSTAIPTTRPISCFRGPIQMKISKL